MSTLVIFRLPNKKLVSRNLDKLATFPLPGHMYLFNGHQFEVESAAEPLTSNGGYMQILALINLEYDTANEAAVAIASMVNLDGSAVLETKIIIASEPDNAILVRLKKPGATSKPRSKATGTGFTLDIQGLLSGNPQALLDISVPTAPKTRRRTPQS